MSQDVTAECASVEESTDNDQLSSRNKAINLSAEDSNTNTVSRRLETQGKVQSLFRFGEKKKQFQYKNCKRSSEASEFWSAFFEGHRQVILRAGLALA